MIMYCIESKCLSMKLNCASFEKELILNVLKGFHFSYKMIYCTNWVLYLKKSQKTIATI